MKYFNYNQKHEYNILYKGKKATKQKKKKMNYLNLTTTNENITLAQLYERLLLRLGSTYFTDIVFLIASIISLIGVLLNLLSMWIIMRESQFRTKTTKFFYYIKVYLTISIVACLVIMPVYNIAKRFKFTNELFASYYICYFSSPLINACYMLSSLIDVATMLDRISLFTRKFDFVVKRYSISFIT
jgi:uncharacterized membrane protein